MSADHFDTGLKLKAGSTIGRHYLGITVIEPYGKNYLIEVGTPWRLVPVEDAIRKPLDSGPFVPAP